MSGKLYDIKLLISLIDKLFINKPVTDFNSRINEFEFTIISHVEKSLTVTLWTRQHIITMALGFVFRHLLRDKDSEENPDP